MPRLLLLCALAATAFCLAAATASAAGCNGDPRLCDRRFDRVVLPGAHNAMSAADAGFQFPNQRIGLAKQLALGIRGFLIDVYYGHVGPDGKVVKDDVRTPQSGLFLCHLVCENGATPLADGLKAFTDFLAARPDEVLQLIVEDYVTPEDLTAAIDASGLGALVYRGATGPRWPTLRQMIAARQQVVVLAEKRAGVQPWYHLAYGGIVQETPYTFAKPSLLTKRRNWRASCKPNRGGRRGSLFLMNHWSPPFAPKAATSVRVNSKRVIVGRANACRKRRGRIPTLIAADMVDVGSLVPAVRALNGLAR